MADPATAGVGGSAALTNGSAALEQPPSGSSSLRMAHVGGASPLSTAACSMARYSADSADLRASSRSTASPPLVSAAPRSGLGVPIGSVRDRRNHPICNTRTKPIAMSLAVTELEPVGSKLSDGSDDGARFSRPRALRTPSSASGDGDKLSGDGISSFCCVSSSTNPGSMRRFTSLPVGSGTRSNAPPSATIRRASSYSSEASRAA
mmetsp:Transcript_22870/g.58161  ORF Transcript_22870/g.58161 Transcript_22870/m.58161 type:complete len:206 (+) Transcript_22870:188-805(+)